MRQRVVALDGGRDDRVDDLGDHALARDRRQAVSGDAGVGLDLHNTRFE